MKEENKIKALGLTALFMGIVAFFIFCAMISCCTPIIRNNSTKEYKEAKLISATIVSIDTIRRLDFLNQYRYIGRIYWEDTENSKWYTYSELPCPFPVGFRISLLTKR